jgi:allantoin racemase
LPLYREMATLYGLSARVAGWRVLESSVPYGDGDQGEVDSLLVQAALELVQTDGCEVVVLAGAVMAGVPRRLQQRVPVPVVEGLSCAVAQAELLVQLGVPKASVGSLATLPARELTGVSAALAAQFGGPT